VVKKNRKAVVAAAVAAVASKANTKAGGEPLHPFTQIPELSKNAWSAQPKINRFTPTT
jgi:hypothetical protein